MRKLGCGCLLFILAGIVMLLGFADLIWDLLFWPFYLIF